MNLARCLLFILHMHLCSKLVDSSRPCKTLSSARTRDSYELRPKDGYFTLVKTPGSANGADLEYEACETHGLVNSIQVATSLPSKETDQRFPPWAAATGYGEKQRNFRAGASNSDSNSAPLFGASKDVVITVEGKPMDQERVVTIAQNSVKLHAPGSNMKLSKEVPAYVIVRKQPAKVLDLDSRSIDNGDSQMVTISLDTLNSLIKGSLYPPSGPSLEHNWYVASLLSDEEDREKRYQWQDLHPGEQVVVLRVFPAVTSAQDVVDGIADPLPGFQEAADGTYRIQD